MKVNHRWLGDVMQTEKCNKMPIKVENLVYSNEFVHNALWHWATIFFVSCHCDLREAALMQISATSLVSSPAPSQSASYAFSWGPCSLILQGTMVTNSRYCSPLFFAPESSGTITVRNVENVKKIEITPEISAFLPKINVPKKWGKCAKTLIIMWLFWHIYNASYTSKCRQWRNQVRTFKWLDETILGWFWPRLPPLRGWRPHELHGEVLWAS